VAAETLFMTQPAVTFRFARAANIETGAAVALTRMLC
jgi:DNA-binding transcriptional LysR family regulator